jgi:hypothetical protein
MENVLSRISLSKDTQGLYEGVSTKRLPGCPINYRLKLSQLHKHRRSADLINGNHFKDRRIGTCIFADGDT